MSKQVDDPYNRYPGVNPEAEHVVSLCSPVIGGKQPLVVLISTGRMFRCDPDPRDFAQGPNHKAGVIWTEIKGPLSSE